MKGTAHPARLLFRAQADWTLHAACGGMVSSRSDPWHPQPKDAEVQYAAARRVCASCPVRLACLADGLYLLETSPTGVEGMWGGHTPAELKELAKGLRMPSRKAAQHGTRAKYVAGCKCELCRWANARD